MPKLSKNIHVDVDAAMQYLRTTFNLDATSQRIYETMLRNVAAGNQADPEKFMLEMLDPIGFDESDLAFMKAVGTCAFPDKKTPTASTAKHTFESIRSALERDAYKSKMPYPDKEQYPHYPKGHLIDIHATAAWNEAEVNRRNDIRAHALTEYRKSVQAMEKVFRDDLVGYIIGEFGLNDGQARSIVNYAWENMHSEGLYSVLMETRDLTEFIVDIIAAGKKPDNGKYVLVEVIERDINVPCLFDTYDEALRDMAKKFADAKGIEVPDGEHPLKAIMADDDVDNTDGYDCAFLANRAYGERRGQNFDYRIFTPQEIASED